MDNKDCKSNDNNERKHNNDNKLLHQVSHGDQQARDQHINGQASDHGDRQRLLHLSTWAEAESQRQQAQNRG